VTKAEGRIRFLLVDGEKDFAGERADVGLETEADGQPAAVRLRLEPVESVDPKDIRSCSS